MDKDTLGRAMEPFFTTKGVGKGTGLGLAMIHGMVEQSGGRFLLKSQKGEGTTAEIWLPAADTVRTIAESVDQIAPQKASRRLTVLAVDDDHLVLFNTCAMLEDLGHSPMEATSGHAALDILAEHAVDLVITDQAMPQMSGVQLCDAIRERWPSLPVILATGYAELPAGADRGLQKLDKPFSERELAAVIGKQFASIE